TPDNIAELFLAPRLIKEPDVLRPNLIEEHAAGRGLDHARILVAVNSIATKIGILESNPVVRSNRAFRHCEFDLNRVRKQRKPCKPADECESLRPRSVAAQTPGLRAGAK